MPTRDHRNHIRSLDGLRGLAILLVFCFHYVPRHRGGSALLSLFSLGWLGVDLFFTLSGFLITGILLDTLPQPGYFRNFYGRRALRLFPAYIAVVAFTLAVSYGSGFHPTLWAIPFFVYGSNIVANLRLPLHLAPSLNVDHLWSLALEEQFYLLWPPLLFLLRSTRRIVIACTVGCALSIALRLALSLHPSPHYVPYNELPTRLDGLLLGSLLAVLWRHPPAWQRVRSLWLRLGLVAAAACILACARAGNTFYWSSPPMVRLGYLASGIGSFCVLGLALRSGAWTQRLGSNGLLRSFGRYSYSLYLWHLLPSPILLPFIAFCGRKLPHVGSLIGFLIALALCSTAAVLSYHVIELPCLRLKRYFAYADEAKAHRLVVDQKEVEAVSEAA